MSQGKVKASKVKVFTPPEGTGGLDGQFHVYVFDVFNKAFAAGRTFDTVEKAASYMRHAQEQVMRGSANLERTREGDGFTAALVTG